jgi:hypothetical protein
VIHEAAFADLSPALATLMRGQMSEGLAGEAKWEDVDRGTFIRFTQFAYTGDYSIPSSFIPDPSPETVEEAHPLNPPESQWLIDDDWSFGTLKKKKTSKKNFFDSLKYPRFKTRPNYDCSSERIGEVLLGHVSLYVLADKWGVETLKMLVLFKLHQTLSMLRLDESKIQDVVDLVRYVYLEERTPDLENGIDGLRELICQYILANTLISGHATFTDLVEEGGPFVRDLWKLAVPRIRITD